MANSKYEYVKAFELDDKLLPDCWIVCRIDGRAFTKSVCLSCLLTLVCLGNFTSHLFAAFVDSLLCTAGPSQATSGLFA
jgi:hypothetical protein